MHYQETKQVIPSFTEKHSEESAPPDRQADPGHSAASQFLFRMQRKEWVLRISRTRGFHPEERIRDARPWNG
jgi:hypothetical protein